MPFADLMNDNVELLKADGTRKPNLKAVVTSGKIVMDANDITIEPGDLVIRRMSNGAEETYRVIDPCFYEAFHGIKAHYQMRVQKLGLPEAKTAVQSIAYHISGNNNRINQNSTDNSSNSVHIDARVSQYIEALRKEIDSLPITSAEKTNAHETVDEIEDSFLSGNPKRVVVSALLKSLPHLANISSIAASIASLLSGGK